MAGIGFELRKYLDEDSFGGTLKAYGFAGLIGAGPWVLSILGVMLIGLVALAGEAGGASASPGDGVGEVRRFTTVVTWMMGASLTLSGLLQLVFTRFVADRLYEGRVELVNPNLLGALLLSALVAGALASLAALLWFEEPFAHEALLVANFVTLSLIWIVVIFVAGLRRFRLVLGAFAAGYAATVLCSLALMAHGLTGLLAGLLAGHALLLFIMLGAIIAEHPPGEGLRFDFLRRKAIFPSLIATGFLYNGGIWVDKLIFWTSPLTSEAVFGPLRLSLIYDLPIFLAYLSIIPGMAVFLLRIETDFAEAYERFFAAVRGGAGLDEIERLGDAMVAAVREGLAQICRVQGATVLALFLLGPTIVARLGLPAGYVHLYYVDLVGVAAQVLMLAILNVLFYLDRLRDALILTATLLVGNASLSALSIHLGPHWYGYGFGLSMVLTVALGLVLLRRELENIEFRTFMRVPRAEETSRDRG